MHLHRFRFPAFSVLLLLTFTFSFAETQRVPALEVSEKSLERWNDLRFGLFIHWGPWSQTEVGYIWKMTSEDSPKEREERFELYKTFDPVNFDPSKWARAARKAGMKYVVFVTKHHDGMNNYDTQLSDFKVTAKESPYSESPQADLTKAIVEAFRAEGLAIGLYYSHIDWHHPDGKYFAREHWDYDANRIDSDPESWERFAAYQKGQLRELLTQYGKIDILWFDIYWPFADIGMETVAHPRVRSDVLDMLKMIKELQPEIIFNDRGTDVYGGFYTPEQRVPETGLPGNWEASITITNGRGYWYKGDEISSKTPSELVRMLVEIASKGGNFLMNVGPSPDGELLEGEYAAMAGVGEWMKVNSESIYGTERGLFYDLPWGFSTTRDQAIYLHVFDWPDDGWLEVSGLRSGIANAYLLKDGSKKSLGVRESGNAKFIAVGKESPSDIAGVVVVELEGEIDIRNVVRQNKDGSVFLSAARARIESETARYNFGRATRHGNFVEGIESPEDRIEWEFSASRSGRYKVEIEYATRLGKEGSRYAVQVGSAKSFQSTTEATADWKGPLLEVRRKIYVAGAAERHDNRWTFKVFELGEVMLEDEAVYPVLVRPLEIKGDAMMYLKSLRLTPVD